MQGILTYYHELRKAQIAAGIVHEPEIGLTPLDLIKGATPEQKAKVKKVFDEYKNGKLKSGSGGQVTDHKQAIAIALSEAGLSKKSVEKCDDETDTLKKDDGEDDEDMEESVEKAFEDLFSKGGPGSNKAGRKIGMTRSGKPIHVLKEAHDYKDFEAVDHLEAFKHHLHHATKVTGVAAVNSQIRAHDHAEQAKIKAAKKELEETETKNAKSKKAQENKIPAGTNKKPAVKKPGGSSNSATIKVKVEKAITNDEMTERAFTTIFNVFADAKEKIKTLLEKRKETNS